ncbi:unnamed protein product [Scytosiphon promiscuus]
MEGVPGIRYVRRRGREGLFGRKTFLLLFAHGRKRQPAGQGPRTAVGTTCFLEYSKNNHGDRVALGFHCCENATLSDDQWDKILLLFRRSAERGHVRPLLAETPSLLRCDTHSRT